MPDQETPVEGVKAQSPQDVIQMIRKSILERTPNLSGDALQREIMKEAQRLYERAKTKQESDPQGDDTDVRSVDAANPVDPTSLVTPASPANRASSASPLIHFSPNSPVSRTPQHLSRAVVTAVPFSLAERVNPAAAVVASGKAETSSAAKSPKPSELLKFFFSAASVSEQIQPKAEPTSLSPDSFRSSVDPFHPRDEDKRANMQAFSLDPNPESFSLGKKPQRTQIASSSSQPQRSKDTHEQQRDYLRAQQIQFSPPHGRQPFRKVDQYKFPYKHDVSINEPKPTNRRGSTRGGHQVASKQFGSSKEEDPLRYIDAIADRVNAGGAPSINTTATGAGTGRTKPGRTPFDPSDSEEDAVAPDEHIDWSKGRPSWTGEARELLNKYKCHFPNCPNSNPANGFKTVKELTIHKDFAHDICHKCNMEFSDWDALLAHKQRSPDHIACWTCGLDFHTAAARERHMLGNHLSLKNLQCPGCGVVYGSGSNFVRHLEKRGCYAIDSEQFQKARLMLTKVLPEAKAQDSRTKKHVVGAPVDSPHVDIEDDEDFPSLSELGMAAKPAKGKGKGRAKKGAPFRANPEVGLVSKLEQLAKMGGLPTEEMDPEQKRLLDVFRRMIGPDYGVYEPPLGKDGRVLHEAIPEDPLYNPAVFRNILGGYNCPHPFCNKNWETERAFDNHLKGSAHSCRNYRCPECLSFFKSADAITAHMESPSVKCNIRRTPFFREAMEVASGSFLTAAVDQFGTLKVDTQEPKW